MEPVKIILFTSKKLKDGSHPIMIRVTRNPDRAYASTGLKIRLENWNPEDQRPYNSDDPENKKVAYPIKGYGKHGKTRKDLSTELAKIEKKIDRILRELEDTKWTAEEFIDAYKDKKSEPMTVLKFFDQRINVMKASNKIGNFMAYKSTRDRVEEYIKHKGKTDISFKGITTSFLLGFREYFEAKGSKANTISVYMRTIRAVYKRAIIDKKATEQEYPFKKDSNLIPSGVPFKRALFLDEWQRFKAVALEDKRLISSRDYFIFSVYCWGINFVDMAELKVSNIKEVHLPDGTIELHLIYTRKKTAGAKHSKPLDIEILPVIKDYVEKHRAGKLDHEYLFPILNTEKHESPLSQYYRAKKVRTQVNHDLRIIGKMAEIGQNITFYSARHTFSTLSSYAGLPTRYIQEALGHADSQMTETYLKSLGVTETNRRIKETINF